MARRIRPIISDLLAYGADLITICARIRVHTCRGKSGQFHAAEVILRASGCFMGAIVGAIITDICDAHLVCAR
jgi:hypothetical protein